MAGTAEPAWLGLARELHAMSQTGLFYSKDKYDTERYERLRVLATKMMAMGAGIAARQALLPPLRAVRALRPRWRVPRAMPGSARATSRSAPLRRLRGRCRHARRSR